jgi:hypothetical protein
MLDSYFYNIRRELVTIKMNQNPYSDLSLSISPLYIRDLHYNRFTRISLTIDECGPKYLVRV